MLELNTAQRRLFSASAHHLNPVVIIGKGGLTEAVISEINRALNKHELIKIKVMEDDRTKRSILLEQICQSLSCISISKIGKILVIYRHKPEVQDDTPPITVKRKPINHKNRTSMTKPLNTFVQKHKTR